jgi:hypothetical protein
MIVKKEFSSKKEESNGGGYVLNELFKRNPYPVMKHVALICV